MDSRIKAGLRGPVRVCRNQQTVFDELGEPNSGLSTRVEYRVDGSAAASWHRNPDGSEWAAKYTYDETGRLREMESRNTTGLVSRTIREYDRAGRLMAVVVRAADGSERVSESFSYDSRGGKTKNYFIDPDLVRNDTPFAYGVDDSDAAYSARGARLITTVYNHADKPAELLLYDVQHVLLIRVKFDYDERGRLREEILLAGQQELELAGGVLASTTREQRHSLQQLFGAGSTMFRSRYAYDQHGRVLERLETGLIGSEWRRFAYNEHGDVQSETWYVTNKLVDIDEEGRLLESSNNDALRAESHFSYRYDPLGNWIERETLSRHDVDKPFKASSVEQRSLTYY